MEVTEAKELSNFLEILSKKADRTDERSIHLNAFCTNRTRKAMDAKREKQITQVKSENGYIIGRIKRNQTPIFGTLNLLVQGSWGNGPTEGA